MKRHPRLRAALGLLMLGLAIGALVLARGTADAASASRERQAEWQRGLAPAPAVPPGRVQRAGEALLGIGPRSDVLRAYQDYRAGLADVIPGTTYPQTRARFEAIKRLEQLRASLRSDADRASVDIVLGVVLTDSASTAGPQRAAQLENALAAFARAVREDPTNTIAKLDLEVLLRATAPRKKSEARPSDSPSRRKQSDTNPRNPTAPAQAEGNGF
jgi:hypothetical protein